MSDIGSAFELAFALVVGLDSDLLDIIARSLYVSLCAVSLAAAIGLPLGAVVAVYRFPGRRAAILPPAIATWPIVATVPEAAKRTY